MRRNIGLTGGIACGKSLARAYFQECGAQTLDADELAHTCIEPGREGHARVVAAFGNDILRADGSIDRAKLGALVFADPVLRRRLEEIVHPLVIQELRNRLRDLAAACPAGLIVADVPLLFECGLQHEFDAVVVIAVPPDIQCQRLMRRDGLTADAAALRMAAQMPVAEKIKAADYVLDNTGTPEDLRRQVVHLYERIRHNRPEMPGQ